MERCPIYVLKAGKDLSPLFESSACSTPTRWGRCWKTSSAFRNGA